MKRHDILQADNAALARDVRERQAREYAELRRVVESGSDGERRALAARNHRGIVPARWQPGRARRV
ncbi:MAG: hypothetical protein U5K43_11875 [Halofilum sp. (in: g-proteobacteria)]|nr:hypothetical protein [Halofilum sp. (in: g-proteobacteria)]